METENKITKCPCCKANLTMHWHRMSKGLANSLIKFKQEVIKRNRNKIHIKDEVLFTKSEYNNFQKLRYHGMVAKCIDPITKKHEAGYWLLTRRGNQFVKNQLSIPMSVQTFRNKIVKKHELGIYISHVLAGEVLPYWDEKSDFDFDYADITEFEEVKFDANGQTTLFY